VLIGLLVACGQSEDRPNCRDGAFDQVARGIAGPVSATGRRVVHYRLPRGDVQLHDVAVAPDGAVWYADMLNSCIGKLDSRTGRVSEYSTASAGANPHGVTVDSAGIVWYAATQHGRIGRIDPATGRSREFRLPPEIRFVHTVLVHAGQVWFTGNPASQDWGTLDPNTGKARIYEHRHQVVTSSDGATWIGLAPTDPLIHFPVAAVPPHRWLVMPDTRATGGDGAADRWLWWHLPTPQARPSLIATDARGRVWYNDRDRSMIGVLDPASVQAREYPARSERAFVDDLAVGADGLIWFYEVRTSSLVGFDPAAGTYESLEIGVADVRVTHMTTDPWRGHVWLGLVDADGAALARIDGIR
jgi:virginiamycin B lyase